VSPLSRLLPLVLAAGFAAPLATAQSTISLSITPGSVSFAYTVGAATLPVAQTLQIKRSGSGAALDFSVATIPSVPWLIVTPTTGRTGTSISLRVNPTSLPAGTYATVLQVDAVGASAPVTASVVLVVKNPPPTMTASPATLSFAWQTDAASGPAAQTISVTTNGEPFSVSVVAAGGTWLTVTPTLGVVLAGSPESAELLVVVDPESAGSFRTDVPRIQLG